MITFEIWFPAEILNSHVFSLALRKPGKKPKETDLYCEFYCKTLMLNDLSMLNVFSVYDILTCFVSDGVYSLELTWYKCDTSRNNYRKFGTSSVGVVMCSHQASVSLAAPMKYNI